MNIHFKRLNDIETRIALAESSAKSFMLRLAHARFTEAMQERNRQRADLKLAPLSRDVYLGHAGSNGTLL